MGDPRLGQFGTPGFGASLSSAQPAQGVLPAPGQDASASSDVSDASEPNTFGSPGLMGQSHSNPGSMYLAEGGAIPDGTQDSGDAAPAQSDPFSIITAAMQTGRKKYGLPAQFFGGQDQQQPAQDEPEPQAFAEGGEVEGEEDQQGVIPTDADGDQDGDQSQDPGQAQGQQGGVNPQGAMAYLSGHGGVSPEVAQALEMRVDPQGQMDPSLRKMLAVTQAGDPDKAFQVMQHYRQKFNALGAFAKAALQGSGGRPPNPAAAADALTKAYQHVPDGTSLQFRPTQGGMQVSSRNVMPGKNEQPEQDQQEEPQQFEDGGPVNNSGGDTEGEDFNMETAGSQSPSGSQYDRGAQAVAAQDDYVPGEGVKGFMNAVTPKRDTNNATQNFILSLPQLLGWTAKDGQFDSVIDKGADKTLAAASQMGQPPQESEGSLGPNQVADQSGVTSQRPMDRGNTNPLAGQQATEHKKTPDDAKAFGAKVGTEGGKDGASLQDVLHEIDQAYPTVGQSQQRALARAAARQHWADNKVKIESEQTKGANALERAKEAGGSRERAAGTNAAARVEAVGLQQAGAGERNQNTVAGRKDVAATHEQGVGARFQQGEQGRNDRTIMQNKPGVIGNKDKMNEARQSLGGQQQQRPAGQQQAQQLPPEAVKNLKEGQNTKFKNGQVWTLRGGQPVQVQ